MTSPAATLRNLLNQPGLIIAPGCYDAISGKLIEAADFKVAYMTGFGTSASVLGMPDAGLISFTEMATHAGNIANALNIPLIADGDTGYGNAMNVFRTVRAYSRAGIAALHLEDQQFPKKCGHVEGKKIVSMEEMVGKLHAAADARAEQDIIVIARTDARATDGVDEALKRSQAYHKAGADIIFFEAPQSLEEIELVGKEIKAPLLFNMAIGGKTPFVPPAQLEKMGYKLAIYPVTLLKSAVKAISNTLEALKSNPETEPGSGDVSFDEIKTLVGFPEYYAKEKKYSS